jgi:hypothetical protein
LVNTFRPLLSLMALCKVALQLFRNKTAADADELGRWFNPSLRQRGRHCMLKTYNITKVTRSMIAYAAVQVSIIIQWVNDVMAFTSIPVDLRRTFIDGQVGYPRQQH